MLFCNILIFSLLKYDNDKGFDIPRYLKLLCDMTQDFEIIDLRVTHEGYEF